MALRRPAAAAIFLLGAAFVRADDVLPDDAGAAAPASASASASASESAPAASAEPDIKAKGKVAHKSLEADPAGVAEGIGPPDSKSEDLLLKDKLQKKSALDKLPPAPAAAGAAPAKAPPPGARWTPGVATKGRTRTTAAAASSNAAVRNQRAMTRANNAASVLRNTVPSGDDSAFGPGAGPGGPGFTGSYGAGSTGGSSAANTWARTPSSIGPDPTRPLTASDIVLASHSGFASSIRGQGFKIGPGPGGAPSVLASDGRLATPAEVSRLATFLNAEPAALMRRPDFFSVLPRSRFEDLKVEYRRNPAAPGPAYQDIGMTEGYRDFRWSASCSPLSGGCNPVEASYLKGQDVAPEALNEVWKKTAGAKEDAGAEGDDDDGMADFTDEDRKDVAAAELAERRMTAAGRRAPALADLLAGLGALSDDARGLFGFGGARSVRAEGSPAAAGFAAGGAGRSGGEPAAGLASAAEARGGRAWTVPSPQIERKTSRRGAAGALAGLAAALFFLWRRSRAG